LQRLRSWTLQEPPIERREDHDDSDVYQEPLPELVPEEQDIHADHDGYQRERVQHDGGLSSHRFCLLFATERSKSGAGLSETLARERNRHDQGRERAHTREQPWAQTRGPGGQHASDSGWSPSPAELADQLIAAALAAVFERDDGELAWCAAQLAAEAGQSASSGPTRRAAVGSPQTASWPRIVGGKLWEAAADLASPHGRRAVTGDAA
jgi:hypothetical protein